MSFSNKKIIKKTNKKEEAVHIDEHIASFQEEYIKKTSKKKLDECEQFVNDYREAAIKKAEIDSELIREKAYKEGEDKAREEALIAAREEMEMIVRGEWESEFQKVSEQYAKANRYLMEQQKKIEDKKLQWILDNEDSLTDILISSVEKIIAREIYLEKDGVKKMIQESINEVNDTSKTVWIRVNPEIKEKIDSNNWNERRIEWIADPKLSKLDVLIETENEWIDSTLKNKIENLKKIIEEWVKDNDLFE